MTAMLHSTLGGLSELAPSREQGWDSAFGVPSASRHVLHMHTEMSAAAVCRCGLSQQFLEQHSHLGLHLLWKGLQQC